MFNRLRFEEHPVYVDGMRAKIFFPNEYGASVICNSSSYGGTEGLYEVAVLKGSEGAYRLCYTTSITDYVIGHLDELGVSNTLQMIANLGSAGTDLSLLYIH